MSFHISFITISILIKSIIKIFPFFTGKFTSSVPATTANVFMLRMLTSDDKFIVGIDLTDGTFQGASMAEKTKILIRKAKEKGITVVSHSQDMGSSNIAC